MIPDKIYFGFDEETHLESYCLEKKGKCQSEYIRKDAVLELLQNRNKEIDGEPKAIFRSFELQEVYRRIKEL